MSKTEISRQLAEQENKARVDSQASEQSMARWIQGLQLDELTEQMAKLAEAMAAMTSDTKGHMREMGRIVKERTLETERMLSLATQAATAVKSASDRITWKMGVRMWLSAILSAPLVVIVCLLWQHHYGAESAQAEAWQRFQAQRTLLTPADQKKLSKILHWDQAK